LGYGTTRTSDLGVARHPGTRCVRPVSALARHRTARRRPTSARAARLHGRRHLDRAVALRALGHRPAPWGLGLNVGPDDETVRQLLRRLDDLVKQNRGPIDIVGWSLGGIMARLLALHHPDRVRQVVSLGSPIRVEDPEANLSDSVRRLSQLAGLQRGRRGHDLTVIPVPSTVIYSRNDGVVAPASCLQPVGPISENIEVRGAHIGLGHNAAAVWAVADRLAQRDGEWAPFAPPSAMSWCYPDPERDATATATAARV
jgi:hypothetical protein